MTIIDRSLQPEVRNPLTALAAARTAAALPAASRHGLYTLFAAVGARAREQAQVDWARGRSERAALAMAVGAYCGHLRVVMARAGGASPPARRGTQQAGLRLVADDAGRSAERVRVPGALVGLVDEEAASRLDAAARAWLAQMLAEMTQMARAKAEDSWRRRKGPMAAYFAAVAVQCARTRRAVRPLAARGPRAYREQTTRAA